MAAQIRNHYEVLGVALGAGHNQIRSAYHVAARKWHPDRYVGKPSSQVAKAEVAMREVNQAWEVLGNKASRDVYDRRLLAASSSTAPGWGQAIETDGGGVTRIDPRFLDPSYLEARRHSQHDEISTRHSIILRAVPVIAVLGLLAAIFVFTAYARATVDSPVESTIPGPNLGVGIAANDCVDVTTGPALLERPCTATADGRVIGARFPEGACPPGTSQEVELSNGSIACLATVG